MSDGDERYRLVYEEARAAIDRQERTLDELRSRAGATLATTVIATAFFGGLDLKNRHLHGYEWMALVLFLASACSQLILLLPLPGWRLRRSPGAIIKEYIEAQDPATIDDMHRDLALHLAHDMQGNDGRLSWMWKVFTVGVVFLVAEVALWLLALSR